MKVILIGAGNVATHLGSALLKANHSVLQVFSRSEVSARILAKKFSCSFTTDQKKISPDADLYIIALRDEVIKDFLKIFPVKNKIIVHTSGSTSIKVFGKKFPHCGVMYPLQTFSIGRNVDFKKVPLCLEAIDAKTKSKLTALTKSLSEKIFYLNSKQRMTAHLAAVLANNFSNHLFTLSERILKKEKLPFEILQPLILETAFKVQQHSPEQMQTGPARRGDASVIAEHLRLLKSDKKLKAIYEMMTESISGNKF